MNPLRPRLILVTGPAGSGKTTLAHELAAAVRCPAICRDEVKEGLVLTASRTPGVEEVTNLAATQAFVVVVRTYLEQGVSVVAEAAFGHEVWSFVLRQLDGLADVAVIRCHTDDAVIRERLSRRASRAAHDDAELFAEVDDYLASFEPIQFDAPTLDVDTTDGYDPTVAQIATFATTATDSLRRW